MSNLPPAAPGAASVSEPGLPAGAEWLPALLRDLAEAHGLGVMLRVAADFGGREIKVPAKATASHPVARAVGLPVLRWLIQRRHPGEKVMVPLGPASTWRRRQALIRKLLAEGVPTAEIVARLGCHTRTVRRHRKALREGAGSDTRQADLFAPAD